MAPLAQGIDSKDRTCICGLAVVGHHDKDFATIGKRSQRGGTDREAAANSQGNGWLAICGKRKLPVVRQISCTHPLAFLSYVR